MIKFFFAHEMFHCIQFQWNPAMNWQVAKWVFDGSADWAAADLYRGQYAPPRGDFQTTWFTQQGRPLAARWYDAWPLFETWFIEGNDAFPAIKAMVQGVTSADPSVALALGGMDGLFFRMRWPSRSMRSRTYADDLWRFPWPGASAGAGPRDNLRRDGTRGLGSYAVSVTSPYAQPQVIVTMNSDVGLVLATPTGGPMTTQAATGPLSVPEGSTGRLCFDPGQCRCPEGTRSDTVQMSGRDMVFSFAATAVPGKVAVVAMKWDPDKECEKPKRPRASSNGDPHLVTFDGQPYDVMTLGEFVNTRDPSGDFEVQTRHVPIGAVGVGSSAVAVGTGKHRMTFTVPKVTFGADEVVRVDGEPSTETSFLLGDVSVRRQGADATLTWPDGSTVEVTYDGGWFIAIAPSEARAGALEGLLGSADGDFTNDLRLPDGTIVDPVHAAKIDSEFSRAWRVDNDSTLFDYEPGESPDTFNLPTPERPADQLDEASLERCTQALGPAAASHEVRSCAYDVTVTGEEQYVNAYVDVVESRIAAEEGFEPGDEKPLPPPSGSVSEPSTTGEPALTLSGTLVSSGAQETGVDATDYLQGRVHTESGTVMVVRAERCPAGATVFATVAEASTRATGLFLVCDPAEIQLAAADEDDEAVPGEVYFWLPASGQYDVTIESDAQEASFVAVEVFVDPEPTIVQSADVIDGVQATLAGIGDTVVLLGPPDAAGPTFTAAGLDVACATEAYGASPLGTPEVWALAGFCAHSDGGALPGFDVPLVIFSRTADPIELSLTPA